MTELPSAPRRGSRRAVKQRFRGGSCLMVLLLLAVLGGGAVFGVFRGMDFLRETFADAADYPGPGKGKVIFEVRSGDTISEMGRNLKEDGVVQSVEAFIAAASGEPDAEKIVPGFYKLKKEMKAIDALTILLSQDNLIGDTVTIPEGLRLTAIVELLAKETDFSAGDLEAVLENPKKLGLPKYAKGNAEGFLFPATYTVTPSDTAETLLAQMVAQWRSAADEASLKKAARKLGYSQYELMIIASLIESESNRDEDRGKVARVIYNRLETPGAPTYLKLELDATVAYALGFNPGVGLTTEQLEFDSPYNTRLYEGLPPGPIEAPGVEAIKAAANPEAGPWFFYVTVNLETGETKFTEDYDEFLEFKDEFCTKYPENC
jgi:UPF0755 protein